MDHATPLTKKCPNCGFPMRATSFGTYIEEHHLNPPLSGVEFPMIARGPGWKCQNPNCEYFEPARVTSEPEPRPSRGPV
jgi:hypothetical protein